MLPGMRLQSTDGKGPIATLALKLSCHSDHPEQNVRASYKALGTMTTHSVFEGVESLPVVCLQLLDVRHTKALSPKPYARYGKICSPLLQMYRVR